MNPFFPDVHKRPFESIDLIHYAIDIQSVTSNSNRIIPCHLINRVSKSTDGTDPTHQSNFI